MVKLTIPQWLWMGELYERYDITILGCTGNKPLKRLIALGYVKVWDTSYPGLLKKYLPCLTYQLTAKGYQLVRENSGKIWEVRYKVDKNWDKNHSA